MQNDLLGHMNQIAVRIGENADLLELGSTTTTAATSAKKWHALSVKSKQNGLTTSWLLLCLFQMCTINKIPDLSRLYRAILFRCYLFLTKLVVVE